MRSAGPYRLLLRFYPRAFRERFGEPMVESFAAELADARLRGRAAVLVLWVRAALTLPLLGVEERLRGGSAGSPSRPGRTAALEGWWVDVRYAVRSLRRLPGFAVVAALTVALGVGATVSLFSVVNALLLRPLPVHEPDRLVRIQERRDRILSSGMEGPRIPWDRYEAYAEATTAVFAGVGAQNFRYLSMRSDGPAFPASGVLASGNYFEVLGLRPAAGRFFAGDDEPVVVLGWGLWQARFGGGVDVVGRTVHVNGLAYTVAGVAPRGFGGTIGFLQADVWVPHGAHGGAAWPEARVSLFGRLRPDVQAQTAQAIASAAALRMAPDDDPDAQVYGVELEPLSATPRNMAGPLGGFLGLLLATAFAVLLIGGANVAGMLLARGVSRRREVAVRLALGVGRARLVRQVLLESVLLFAFGGAGGLLVAAWTARIISSVRLPISDPVLLDAPVDARVLSFALVIALGTGMLFGLLPALQSARAEVAWVLRDGGRGASVRGGRLRDVFVAAQLALSVLLLVVATLFVRTLQRATALDPGFRTERVLIAATNLEPHDYDEQRAQAFYDQLLERVRAHPDVESAGLGSVALLTGEHDVFSGWRLTPDGGAVTAGQSVVDSGYFPTMEIELVAGRGVAPGDDAGAASVVVVNESFARRFWPDGNAVGQIVLRGDRPHEVVGIVRDGAYVEFGEDPAPFAFLSVAQRFEARRVLHVRQRPGASTAALLAAIRADVAALDADVAVEQAGPLTAAIEFLLFPQRFAAILIGLFGVLGLVLAAIGVYGVLAHNVARRTREFGIRIALGADARELLGIVLRRGILLAAAGTAVGLGGAAALTHLLRAWLHGVSPLDARAFVGVPLVLGAMVLLASALPARHTLRVDPVEALRRE